MTVRDALAKEDRAAIEARHTSLYPAGRYCEHCSQDEPVELPCDTMRVIDALRGVEADLDEAQFARAHAEDALHAAEAREARLREATVPFIEAASVMPEEWIELDSSMAMAITVRCRDVAALLAALAPTEPEAEP